ncbi:transcriptional regulator [Ammoniphilus oxalaticus]|uniref:Transcriptional regulator n=1 Tax=Ammoniphilus oxalaticus TaxID=66863 RepID=A0A419SQW8_9BACL|nr:LysR family transcriptional regulator [Ammoniphilus oxalaticus]RKD26788.1 transcriptional regulator [Ammoniphilus oxalaticus]
MELRQLRYALMLAEEKNFSRAAEKLHLAQPSLSQQIIKLEKELSVSLFERRPGSLQLTYAGKRFIDQASRIIDQVEQLKQEMMDVAESKKGQLVIGSLPITGARLLPQALQQFQHDFPGIELVLVEEPTAQLESLTARGQTDFSLLSLPLHEQGLDFIPVLEEDILLAVPPQHRFGTLKEAKLADCQDEPFILLKKGQGFRQIAAQLCQQVGFEPQAIFETTNIETLQSLVASGMGIGLIPKMVTRSEHATLRPIYLPISDIQARRTLVLAYKKGRYLSKAGEQFISLMKRLVKQGNY